MAARREVDDLAADDFERIDAAVDKMSGKFDSSAAAAADSSSHCAVNGDDDLTALDGPNGEEGEEENEGGDACPTSSTNWLAREAIAVMRVSKIVLSLSISRFRSRAM